MCQPLVPLSGEGRGGKGAGSCCRPGSAARFCSVLRRVGTGFLQHAPAAGAPSSVCKSYPPITGCTRRQDPGTSPATCLLAEAPVAPGDTQSVPTTGSATSLCAADLPPPVCPRAEPPVCPSVPFSCGEAPQLVQNWGSTASGVAITPPTSAPPSHAGSAVGFPRALPCASHPAPRIEA